VPFWSIPLILGELRYGLDGGGTAWGAGRMTLRRVGSSEKPEHTYTSYNVNLTFNYPMPAVADVCDMGDQWRL